jgi:peptidoglycan/LPS O-acetylase OafA/YrhL
MTQVALKQATTIEDRQVITPARLYYLDWIRVVVIAGVFVGHTMLVFSGLPWLITSEEHLVLVTAPLLAIGNQIAMPLLFLVSGAATWFSLRKRTGKQFLGERFFRLVIPYWVFVVLLSPIQAYYEAVHHGTYEGSFLAYLPHFFNLDRFTAFDLTWAGAYGYHLWFMMFLFFYSAVSLPLFLHLRRGKAQWLPALLVRVCRRPGGILLLAVPIALSQVILRINYGGYQSWADTAFWGFFYIYGYLFLAEAEKGATLDGHAKAGLLGFAVSGILLLGLGLLTVVGISRIYDLSQLGNIPMGTDLQLIGTSLIVPAVVIYIAAFSLISLNSWAGVVFLMNFMHRFANKTSHILDYLGEISMPFYIIHHPVLVVFAYYIVRLPINVWLQMILLFFSAGSITWGIIELFIRRIRFLRSLVGMKPEPGGIKFNLRRSAPWQATFTLVVLGYVWLLSALSA